MRSAVCKPGGADAITPKDGQVSFCDGITDLSLEAIGAHLRRLRVLKLACCTSGVTDAGVASLTPLEELEELSIIPSYWNVPRVAGTRVLCPCPCHSAQPARPAQLAQPALP